MDLPIFPLYASAILIFLLQSFLADTPLPSFKVQVNPTTSTGRFPWLHLACLWYSVVCSITSDSLRPMAPLLLFSHTVVYDSATPWIAARQASLFLTISWSLPKFMPITSVMPSNHLILWCLFSCLQSFPASGTFPMSQLFTSDDQNTDSSLFFLFSHLLELFFLTSLNVYFVP